MAIAALLFAHLWIKHFGNPGKIITFQGSAERLHQPLWLILGILMIAGILFHSLYGLRSILMDYVTGQRRRRVLLRWFLAAGILFFIVYLFSLTPFVR